MKTKLALLITLLITTFTMAQNGINYKALIKDNLGNVVANQTIDLKIIILKGALYVYEENHSLTTDGNGIAIVNIGEGTETFIPFSSIDWASGTHFLKTEIDLEQDGSFVDMGTTEFKAVPYALSAANVSGLEAIGRIDGSIGWRLLGRDPANYSLIGSNAVDLSYSTSESVIKGASGNSATAIGINTEASGSYSTATGNQTMASGDSSTAMGFLTTASEDFSTAIGSQTIASGISSTAMGFKAIASGNNSTAIGSFVIADDNSSTVVGTYNDDLFSSSSLFQVGNGSFEVRSNAFNVDSDGTITAPSFDISEIIDDKALITKEYLEANGSVSSGLEAIDEGNGIGWRLTDANPTYYGNIGDRAVDLSYGGDPGYDAGLGAYGTGSVALGQYTSAGNGSVAMGYNATASGQYATAMGNVTTASGFFSTTTGFYTVASALYSTALGNSTIADDQNTTVLGAFNANTLVTNTLFQVGNGTNNDNRSNAFVVDTDGVITAPSFDISEITDNKALITKEFADANYLGGGSGTNPTGLETLNEGNGSGWRLVGRDSDNYADIGLNALDLSHSNSASSAYGASGTTSIATGFKTTASGHISTALGYFTSATGTYATAMGSYSIAVGENATAMGSFTNAYANNSTAMGIFTNADDPNSTVVGKYNAQDGPITASLFEVGNGTSVSNRSNAFTVMENGAVAAPSFDISEITDPKALITKEYLEANSSFASGLEAIDEGNGIGRRLTGINSNNYGNIGENAVDLSSSLTSSTSYGATGLYSSAMGYETEAYGLVSTAIGFLTKATGLYATAMGNQTKAIGDITTAMGLGTIADDAYSTVMGKYNENATSTSTLLQVGNGSGLFGGRSNALTVLQNGYTAVGTHNDAPTADFHVYHGNGTSNGFKLQNSDTNANWWRFYTLNSNGNLNLYSKVGGNTNAVGSFNNVSGAYTALSDRRVKDDFKELYFNWDSFMQLKPLTYYYKTDENKQSQIGFIAQDVASIYPELVNYNNEDDLYQLNYSGFGVVAIKAIQELNKEVKVLSEENKKLKAVIVKQEILEARLLALEKNKALSSKLELAKN